jgi:Cu(I)/Ag(I) efflux system membrane fusion protein
VIEKDNDRSSGDLRSPSSALSDEGGLHAPPGLHGWRKAWWWFDFVVLVNLARLRFIGILFVIGIIIMKWDWLVANYDKLVRPASAAEAAEPDVEYFCPMHPTIIRDHPDKCPICYMPLSKRKKGTAETAVLPAGVVNRVQLSPYRIILAGIQTRPVDYERLTKDIGAVGFVEFNERGQRTVSARVAGRIDKLMVNETGQMVEAGDPLALLYSPDLQVTVRNLLDAKRTGNGELLSSARSRLELLGIDKDQIDDILTSGKADANMEIRSPIGGHVINKYVREGQYVAEGTALYEVADLSTVWIQGQVYEDDIPFLPAGKGQGSAMNLDGLDVTATTRAFPDEVFHGKLTFIYPHVDEQTRTVAVRFELENPDHKLRPGSTATVTLKVKPQDLPLLAARATDAVHRAMIKEGRFLAVPDSSIIDTGNQKIVYREVSTGVYEGVEVKLGPRMSTPNGAVFYPVLEGLKQGDLVVSSGSFLVDAETRLNPAIGSVYFGGSGGSQTGRTSVSTVRPSTPEDPDAKIRASLATLSADDRKLAETQRFCPILSTNRLGSMGQPLKLMIEGQPVFLCCPGCKEKALADPQGTLAKVAKLKQGEQPSQPAESKRTATDTDSKQYDVIGKVVAVDLEKSTVTIDHKEIPGLMPAMEMLYKYEGPQVVAGIAAGDKVQGRLEVRSGNYVITELHKR